MKYLLIFFIVMVLVFQWRSSRADIKRKAGVKPNSAAGNTASGPQSMVACVKCGVHVPAGDAVQGATGLYCSVAHRQLQES
jgi:uncharacterized protein